MADEVKDAEIKRLEACGNPVDTRLTAKVAWKKWGPYLSERQWGTVREDYPAQGWRKSTIVQLSMRSHPHKHTKNGHSR